MSSYLRKSNDSEVVLLKKRQVAEEQKSEREAMSNAYRGENARHKAGCCSQLFFNWVSPVLKHAKKHRVDIEDLGVLRADEDIRAQKVHLQEKWEHYKTRDDTSHRLYWATLSAYKWEFAVAIFWNLVIATLQLSAPFIMRHIIVFIYDKDPDTAYGLTLVGILGATLAGAFIISEHMVYYTRMMGSKATNSLSAMIFNKSLKLSPATNKKFGLAQVVNFVQVDAVKMQFLTGQAPMVFRLPFVLFICFIVLFTYLGWSFFSAILLFIVTFSINMYLTRVMTRLTKQFMVLQDRRVKAVTESLSNIKMIKLHAWTPIFQRIISDRRIEELDALWSRMQVSQILVTNLYFFPQILTAVVFAFYIGFGNNLSLDAAFTIIVILNLIKDPLRSLPMFVGQLIEFRASMLRIQNYLLVEEINHSVVDEIPRNETEYAIRVCEGSAFHYGTSKSKTGLVSRGQNNSAQQNRLMRRDSVADGTSLLYKRSASFTSLYQPMQISNQETDNTSHSLNDFLTLKQIDFSIKHGSLVCIVGDVGSGKSSILNCITNDMHFTDSLFFKLYCHETIDQISKGLDENAMIQWPPHKAPVVVSESISLVQQNPWIQNMTIKDNILFGASYNPAKYAETISICQLKRELDILPSGDMTEIGEKGISLTVGQKARISLARAIYADKEAILMDDPLSSLEPMVQKKIFKQVLMTKLKGKTRVLVTHASEFLHLADSIIGIKDGQIEFEGAYAEVKQHPYLRQLIKEHRGQLDDSKSLLGSSDFAQEEQKVAQIITSVNTGDDYDDDGAVFHAIDMSKIPSDSEDSDTDADEIQEIQGIEEENEVGYVRKRAFSIGVGNAGEDQKKMLGQITTSQAEEASKVNFATYKRYMRYAGGFTQFLITNLALICFIILKVCGDYLVGEWATTPEQHTKFAYYCGIYFFVLFWQSVMVYFRMVSLTYYSIAGTKELHDDMVDRTLNAPMNTYFDTTPLSRVISRFSKDLSVVESTMVFEIGTGYVGLYNLLSIFGVAAAVIPWILFFFPVVILTAIWLYKHSIAAQRETTRIEAETRQPLLSYLSETINGNPTIRAFRKERQFIEHNYSLLNRNILATQWQNALPMWFAIRVDLLSIFTMMLIASFCVLFRNQANPVLLTILLVYSVAMQSYIISTIIMMMRLETRMVSADRCIEQTRIEQENMSGYVELDSFKRSNPNWPTDGEIVFDDVTLKPRPTTDSMIEGLSFKIESGERIAIIGRTGAGKSTIFLSLSRVVEILSGQICIDGVELRSVPAEHLRKCISVIPQEPTIFTGTLRFNLDPEGKIDDDQIMELLRVAQLEDLLHRDPKGLDMLVGQPGGASSLTLGEKQLLCICRVILRKSKVVILDEPSANIDAVAEQKMQSLVSQELEGNCTLLTITRQPRTIMQSDRTMVISQGKVLEFDDPSTLTANPDSDFSRLLKEYESQEQSMWPFNSL